MKTKQQSTHVMKYSLVVLAFLTILFSSALSFGQSCKKSKRESKWGVKGGFSFSNFYVDDIQDDSNLRKGFHAGIGGRIPVLGKFIALQPEVLYSNKGITANYLSNGIGARHEFALNYLDVPVMASVKLLGMNMHAGVYGSYLLKGKVSVEESASSAYTSLTTDDFNPFDFGYTGANT